MLTLIFTAAALCFGAAMNSDQKQCTGINKLEAKRDKPLGDAAKPKLPAIQENLHNGRYIRLSDGTSWEINPKDTPITQSWITPADVVIKPSNDPNYPFSLTNSLTGSTVLARKADFIPKAPSPAPAPTPGPTTPPVQKSK